MYPRKYFAFSSAIFVSPACGLFNLCGDEYFLKRELTLSSTPDSLVGDKSDVWLWLKPEKTSYSGIFFDTKLNDLQI